MHCHACWPRFCHDTFALLALNFYGVACTNNKNNVSIHATCMHTFVQRLWLPRQAARRRSCCNLYAKLFYKLSKKDGVSRKHSRCCTHTLIHVHIRLQVGPKWGKQAGMSHQPRLQRQHQLQLQKGFSLSLSMSSIRNSHRHSQSFLPNTL